jgi:5-methylcytosine-specific restriction protein A
MPIAANKPCGVRGCPELVDSGYCKIHRVAAHEADRLHRGSSSSRGYDHDWQRVRLQALKRDRHLCTDCADNGRVTPAKDVHHLANIAEHPGLRLAIQNLKSLCRECHSAYTRRGL